MPTIVGILIFISRNKYSVRELRKREGEQILLSILVFMSIEIQCLVESDKKYKTSCPKLRNIDDCKKDC